MRYIFEDEGLQQRGLTTGRIKLKQSEKKIQEDCGLRISNCYGCYGYWKQFSWLFEVVASMSLNRLNRTMINPTCCRWSLTSKWHVEMFYSALTQHTLYLPHSISKLFSRFGVDKMIVKTYSYRYSNKYNATM